MLLAIVLDPLLVCLSVSSKPFRPALPVFHACNVLLASSNVLLASSQALLVRCPALLALLALLQISSIALLVGLHPLLMHGTALRTALLVVLHPFLVCLPVLHPPLVCPHAPKVHCPALLALPALLQKGCTARFVGCDPFRPALLVFHACNMLPASSQALLVRCPALLALLALLQISSIALLVSLEPLHMHGSALRTALLVVLHPF